MRRLPQILVFLATITALLPFLLHYNLIQSAPSHPEFELRYRLEEIQGTASWTLFYHIYLPNDGEQGYQHAINIVQEQLAMVGKSHALKSSSPVLYYTVIGEKFRDQEWMDDTCRRNNLRCKLLRYMKEGQEDETLQSLYEFCKAVPSQSVIYLHTKGSFHSSGPKFSTQDIWRQRLTEASTHGLCLDAVTTAGHCDTCSLLLQPLPGIHYPGNMWTARCTYVRRLLPPKSFADRMDKVVNTFKRLRDTRKRLNTTFFPQMPHMMGRKRFAAEHWLGSHPSLLSPCDLSAHVTANMSEWLHPDEGDHLSPADFSLGHSPTYSIEFTHWDYFRYGKRGSTVLNSPALRLRDYFLLPGQLLKWQSLYQQLPPPNSWIWTWFPDADVWREKIRRYGNDFWREDTDDWLPPLIDPKVSHAGVTAQ